MFQISNAMLAKRLSSFGLFTIFLLLFLCGHTVQAQESATHELEAWLEEIVAGEDGEDAAGFALEDLLDYLAHPTNLRAVSLEELRLNPILLPGEAEKIKEFLAKYPDTEATEAIGIALNMPPKRMRMLTLFFTLDYAFYADSLRKVRFMGELAQRAGYRFPLYDTRDVDMERVYKQAVGSQLALQTRFMGETSNGFRFGLKGVKRAGEPFFRHFAPQGYPYYSVFVQYKGEGYRAPTLLLGDYTANFASGLTVGSGPPLLRSLNPQSWGLMQNGIRGKLGMGDNTSLRGLAVQQQPTPWCLYSFAISAQPLTTRIIPNPTDSLAKEVIASIPSAPLYTKEREQERHFNSWEFVALGHLRFTFNSLNISYSFLASHYNRDFAPTDTAAFLLPPPARTAIRNGIALHWYFNSWRIWAEGTLNTPLFAKGSPIALSGATGAVYSPSYSFALGIQGFYYPYHAASRYAYGSSSRPQNRAGAMLYLIYRPLASLTITVGGEFSHYPNPRVIRSVPQNSAKGFLEAIQEWQNGMTLEGRYRFRMYENVRGWRSFLNAQEAASHEVRLRSHLPTPFGLAFRATAFYAYRDSETPNDYPHNWAIAQDFIYHTPKNQLAIYLRGAYFDARGQGITLYLYENAPRYAMAINRMSSNGYRAYLMARWNIIPRLSLSAKCAATRLTKSSLEDLSLLEQQRRDMLETMLQIMWRF